MRIKFTQSARKHRIGRAHAMHVVNNNEPVIVTPASVEAETEERRTWVGVDDRGVELEIIGVVLPEYLLIIHVMPTQYRRTR